MGRKPNLTDFYILDDESLKRGFSREQLIELEDDLIKTMIDMVTSRFSNMGIETCSTGSIDPKYYKSHGLDVGLKIWMGTHPIHG